MKGKMESWMLVAVFLAGMLVMLYPMVSNYINLQHQSRAIADYDARVQTYTPADYAQLFAAAEAYNIALAQQGGILDPYDLDTYQQLLNVGGSGIMGYVSIEKIRVELPIYHGTEDRVLNVAAGHLEGSSLPTGGRGNHTVLSAHRGLPSAQLFTRLDELEVGDSFSLYILDRRLTYVVDQISIVEPDDISRLQIEPDRDYCTLVTCTPYGINTHRLLVRGQSVQQAQDRPYAVSAEAYKIDPLLVAPVVTAPMLLLLFFWLIGSRPKRRGGGNP